MARQHRKVVPLGGQHQTHDEWYDDETGKLLPPPEPEVTEDAETGEQTEATDARGSDGAAPESEVPVESDGEREPTETEPEDGDGGSTAETD